MSGVESQREDVRTVRRRKDSVGYLSRPRHRARGHMPRAPLGRARRRIGSR
jgi:hypothetical protein